MKPVYVDRTAEKVAIAKELGLHTWADLHEIIDMKFPRIETWQIQKRLSKLVFHSHLREWQLTLIQWLVISNLIVGTGWNVIGTGGKGTLLQMGFLVASVGIVGLFNFRKCQVKMKPLSQWSDNLPYGALLAVKEAKSKGLTNFTVCYPAYQQKEERRVWADPIIIATKTQYSNLTFEVFAWDDGKVYE